MSASDLLQLLTQVPFILVFVVTAAVALRQPRRANVDTALLFGAAAIVIAIAWIASALNVKEPPALAAVTSSVAMALPYLLLRLVDDFSDVPRPVMRAAEAGLALAIVSLIVLAVMATRTAPVWLTLLLVLYFFGFEVYAAVKFALEARRTGGVTRRRMQAVAAGSVFLGLAILTAGLQAAAPNLTSLWLAAIDVFAIASGLSYFIGFAPPSWLRHAWQEPELRAFLGRAAFLPRLPDTHTIVRELEQGAASSIGAPGASIGLWDEDARVLRFYADRSIEIVPGRGISGRAFAEQRPLFWADMIHEDPENAEIYRRRGVVASMAAPISAGSKRLGVLVAYAARAPIFAGDDLALLKLLADQAAVILESRALIDEAARVQAREEATKLKDDFLSSAAHDLKTPLTTLIAQAQLLERRAISRPDAPVDVAGVQRLVRESKRLNKLVLELLDAARLEEGGLLGARQPVDLVALAKEVCAEQTTERHPCSVDAEAPIIGWYDRVRINQLIENLIENGIKYSPEGGTIDVRVWSQGDQAHLTVTDHGIGIPAADLPNVFIRFHRGSNVDDRRFAGLGLGLYICKKIVEQHNGRIWISSRSGEGSTFHVALPLADGDKSHE